MKSLVCTVAIVVASIAIMSFASANAALACSHPWLVFNGTSWQDTCDNSGSISQSGGVNLSVGVQSGSHNHYVEDVGGSGNVVAMVQGGSGNAAGVHISGDNHLVVESQTGTGAWSTIGASGDGDKPIVVTQSN